MTEEKDAVERELAALIQAEQQSFSGTGKLSSPQRHERISSQPPREHQLKHTPEVKMFQLVLPGLRYLFQCLCDSDLEPNHYVGLLTMCRAASVRSPSIGWVKESELQKRIREKQEEAEAAHKLRSQEARKLAESQIVPRPEHDRFLVAARNSMMDDSLASASEKYRIGLLQRSLENEALQADLLKKSKIEQGELRKAAARREVEERKKQREAQLQGLLAKEEDTRELLDAVYRVRLKFEEEKKQETSSK